MGFNKILKKSYGFYWGNEETGINTTNKEIKLTQIKQEIGNSFKLFEDGKIHILKDCILEIDRQVSIQSGFIAKGVYNLGLYLNNVVQDNGRFYTPNADIYSYAYIATQTLNCKKGDIISLKARSNANTFDTSNGKYMGMVLLREI